MRRIYWKYYICYTFGFVVMGLHLMLKYSISYMDLETEDDNSMYPRELKSPTGEHLSHENCIHHRHLQQEELHQIDTGLVRGLTGTTQPYSLVFRSILLPHSTVSCHFNFQLKITCYFSGSIYQITFPYFM